MRAVSPVIRAIAFAIVLFVAFDRIFDAFFPHFARLRYNFSAAYLKREARALQASRPIVVLGDSVLWGFGLEERQTAVSLLRARDPLWHNLAYAGGSPVNTLAMLRFLQTAGVHPRAVIFNVNQKQFNLEDSAYQKLHPAVEEAAWGALSQEERAALVPVLSATSDARIDRSLSRFWHFYGMRSDVRDALFNDSDAAHRIQAFVEKVSGAAIDIEAAHRPTAEKFEGTYDLSPIAQDNVAFVALLRIGKLLRSEHIPALAVLTPTNHLLLHDYIDSPAYRSNLGTVKKALERAGVRVLDLDARFPAADFIDNDHLTAIGNAKLARLLQAAENT